MKQSSQEIANMENKYRRAQALMQGCWTRTIVANSTLYPIWIEGSECFWYEREINLHKNAGHPDQPLSKWDREYRLVNATVSTNNLAFDHEVLAAALAEAAQQDHCERVQLAAERHQCLERRQQRWWWWKHV